MLDVRILDGDGTGNLGKIQVYKDANNGLIVSTRPYNYYRYKIYQFLNDTYGDSLNIPIILGTPENVHNGIDSTYWTGSSISGTAPTFNSTARAYNGTRSILWSNPTQSSVFELAKGSNLDLTNYIYLTMWIYVVSDWEATDSVSIYGYNAGQIGNKVYLQNYCAYSTYGVWQKINIPLTDMGLNTQTIVAFRVQMEVRNGPKSSIFSLDVIDVQSRGSSELGYYTVEPLLDTWFFIKELNFTLVDVYNGTSGYLNYNKILNLTQLDSGINVIIKRREVIRYQFIFKDITDFMNYGGRIKEMRYDGSSQTFLVLTLEFADPIVLQSEYQDTCIISITEDLSGLTYFKVTAIGNEEYKIDTELYKINVY